MYHCERFGFRRCSGEERLDRESWREILATDGTRMAEDKDGDQQELRPTGATDGPYAKLLPSRGPRNLRLSPISSSFFAKLPTVG